MTTDALPVSLSTMWAIDRFDSMASFVATAKRLGFRRVEANYQLTPTMIADMARLRDAGEVVVSSVHDPASLPPGVPLAQLPQLSSLDEAERKAAISLSRHAIDVAVRLGAKILVVHPGSIAGLRPLEARMRDLFSIGPNGSCEFADLRKQLSKERQHRRGAFLRAVTESLNELASYADAHGLRLGLENRFYYHEIPLVDEVLELLNNLKSNNVGFWYDIGHAHVLDVLGFVDEMRWLIDLGSQLVGLHLHDAVGLRDHLAPGAGEIDFGRALPYVPSSAVRVCELGSFNSEAEIAAGFHHLRHIGYF